VNNPRPVNLNLLTIRFPIPAIISILHRVSGVVLFLLIPIALWALSYSLASEDNFQHMHDSLASTLGKLIIWVCLMPFLYHFVAGIRHLLMDINIGVELQSGRFGAILTVIISFILILLAGVYIW
jgi:succinate dehydrogenase / fumarate reductase cytochrome b subunit